MRKPTIHELRRLEGILKWISPVVKLDYVYNEGDNTILLGDNYIIKGGTHHDAGVSYDIFRLIYGETHPGDTEFDLNRWEEEDVAVGPNVDVLLPVFVGTLFQRIAEEKVYTKIRLGYPIGD